MWIEYSAHSLVAIEIDADEIPSLLLIPIRSDPDILYRGYGGLTSVWKSDANLNLERNILEIPIVSAADIVCIGNVRLDDALNRRWVPDTGAHQMVDNLPGLVGRVGPVNSGNHRTIVDALLSSEILSQCSP